MMNKAQLKKIEKIRQKWMKFKYKGQTDHDIRFLLRMLLEKDPNF